MADISALKARRGELIDEISTAEALKQSAVRAKFSAKQKLDFGGNQLTGARRTQLQAEISQAQAQINEQTRRIDILGRELGEVNLEIAQTQIQQGPQASAGQQVKESQTARDDGASPVNPPPPVQVTEDGRVVTAQDRPASNAQRPEPGAVDAGTDAPLRTARNTQSTPPITAQPGGARPSAGSPSPSPTATQNPGATASGDDNPGGTAVRARLDALFGGPNNEIVSRPNILDNYASYTYNISVYLMNPEQYATMIRSKKKNVAGYQLLFMSGGAGPMGTLVPNDQLTSEDPVLAAQERIANLGRNEFFSLDYYIDDVQAKSFLSGKGSGGAHNVFELKFKVIEPYGMTFLENLFAATQQYIKVSGGDINKNYAAQNYLMVIRFYGYDEQGNLVQASRTGQDAAGTDVNAVVEKFIPFQFTSIKFRIANKTVEYECNAVCPQNNVNTGASRGVIPYNIELQSQTLKDLLTGTPKFAGNDGEGRVTPTAPPASGSRTPSNAAASGLATANASAKSFAARQAEAAAKVNAARREQLGLSPNPSPPPGASTAVSEKDAKPSTAAPAKADAARNKTLVTGLVDALNKFQAEISGPGAQPQLYPDTYNIVIVDEILQQAKVVPPGETNLKQVPMTQAQTANQQKNPATQKVDNNAKTTKVIAGTSIIQFLDQLVRTSTYIYDQQIYQYDPKIKELRPNGTPAETVGWFRIGLQAVPQMDKFDTKRNDYAYDITYQINIYAVSDVKSDFFSPPKYRGAQKIYNYWFTGENTQILDFSQDFNYLYYIVSNGPRQPRTGTSDVREIERRYFQVNSPQSSQGQDDDKVNEPSANAADYLYSPGDQARVRLKIIGDPAWIFQGETWAGIAGQNLLYDAFLPDDTINIETQEVLFRVGWNSPVDYDLETGIQDPTTKNYYRKANSAGEPQQSYVYKAITCYSNFSRGKFDQELNGQLMIYALPQKSKIDTARNPTETSSTFARGPDQTDAETRRLQAASDQARLGGKTWADRQQQAAVTMRNARREQYGSLLTVNSGPLATDSMAAEGFTTAAADQPPTSGGQVVGTASTPTSLFGQSQATGTGTGNPVVTYTTQTGRVVTASSEQDIKDAFNAGYINKVTQNNLTRQLTSLQQQANSPTTSAPRQVTRRDP